MWCTGQHGRLALGVGHAQQQQPRARRANRDAKLDKRTLGPVVGEQARSNVPKGEDAPGEPREADAEEWEAALPDDLEEVAEAVHAWWQPIAPEA